MELKRIEELWSEIDRQNKNKKIDKGTVKKIRYLLDEAMKNKELLSQDQLNWLLNVEQEVAKFEKVDANPYNIPDAVTDKITGVGSY
ncbi:hypothetical protein BS78_05G053800 [Paspalum vaginatum]|nr:hypothetical protein BS78_05G053800 [Paspalum vaginatum]